MVKISDINFCIKLSEMKEKENDTYDLNTVQPQ
jgi:hypothetical protein